MDNRKMLIDRIRKLVSENVLSTNTHSQAIPNSHNLYLNNNSGIKSDKEFETAHNKSIESLGSSVESIDEFKQRRESLSKKEKAGTDFKVKLIPAKQRENNGRAIVVSKAPSFI
jgi:hypothetical protein